MVGQEIFASAFQNFGNSGDRAILTCDSIDEKARGSGLISANSRKSAARDFGLCFSNSELHRFLQISCGSANELEYHLLLAKDLGYIEQASYQSVLDKLLTLKRMLVALTRKVAAERGTN